MKRRADAAAELEAKLTQAFDGPARSNGRSRRRRRPGRGRHSNAWTRRDDRLRRQTQREQDPS